MARFDGEQPDPLVLDVAQDVQEQLYQCHVLAWRQGPVQTKAAPKPEQIRRAEALMRTNAQSKAISFAGPPPPSKGSQAYPRGGAPVSKATSAAVLTKNQWSAPSAESGNQWSAQPVVNGPLQADENRENDMESGPLQAYEGAPIVPHRAPWRDWQPKAASEASALSQMSDGEGTSCG